MSAKPAPLDARAPEEKTAAKTMGKPMTGKRFDAAQLDPGIRHTVLWLRNHGFKTTDSGDGKTKLAQGFTEDDGVIPFPHVVIRVPKSKLAFMADVLADMLVDEFNLDLDDSNPSAPRIEASYSPVTGVAMLLLVNVDDAALRGDR